jgi:DNA-binding transcriptional regulator YdaS (Cro superfamily)
MAAMEKLLQIWPTAAALAQDLGLPYPTVAAWKERGIPARRAPAIVQAARARGHVLTLDDLLMPAPPSPEEDAA